MALLAVPIFVMVSPAGAIALPTGTSVDALSGMLSIPISVVLCGLLIATSRGVRNKVDPISVLLAVFIFVNVLAFVVGSLIHGISLLSLAFLIQTMLPLLGYVVGARVGGAPARHTERALLWFSCVPLLCLLGIALTTLAAGGHPWSYVGENLGPLAVPQARRYLPTAIAFALIVFCRALFPARATLPRVLLALTTALFLSASHARTGVVVVAIGFAVYVAFDLRVRAGSRVHLVAMSLLAGMLLFMAISSGVLSAEPTAVTRLAGGDDRAQLSSERRSTALVESITESFEKPLGRMYQATEDESLGGTKADFARVSNAENQIGEYGLRAGPLALLAVYMAIGSVLWRSRRVLSASARSEPVIEGLWLALSATISVTAFTQVALSQPYTGVVIWFGLGVLRTWAVRNGSVRARRSQRLRRTYGTGAHHHRD